MTERERREGTGGTRENVHDDLDEAARGRQKKDAAREAEEGTGGGGGVKDNVTDDHEKTQE